ncbi:MAG: FecR family protein, partial [Pirellulaceae bacterium]
MSNTDHDRLIAAWLDGRITEGESRQLQQLLRDSVEVRREFVQYARLDSMLREQADGEATPLLFDSPEPGRMWSMNWAATVMVIAVLLGVVLFIRPESRSEVALISGASGPLRWTGNEGLVVHDLSVGDEISGGTIDGLSPFSWFELTFRDGSVARISGNSMLTFSDQGQKKLHLKSGFLSANVKSQPVDKPMLIYTPSASLVVIGTTFEVQAGVTSTELNVSDGQVLLTRLSDGESVVVPAEHRAVASIGRELLKEKVPEPVYRWKTRLELGPSGGNREREGIYGEWFPAKGKSLPFLKAIPLVPKENPSVTLYLAGLPVSRLDHKPVLLKDGWRFVLRGQLEVSDRIYFGIRVREPGGDVYGKFLAKGLAKLPKGNFETVFEADEFVVDPSERSPERLPESPSGWLLHSVWCFTYKEGVSGLAVTEVELLAREDRVVREAEVTTGLGRG